MNRRKVFQDICSHRNPEKVLMDLGGCPLSDLSQDAAEGLYRLMGFEGTEAEKREKLFRELDVDTRGVGSVIKPPSSLAKRISDTEYIDAWGVRRRFTGLYYDIVEYPLANATLEDLERYPWPDPDEIDQSVFDETVRQARRLHEETDYVVCASHPVYGIFELGCWMVGFEEFMVRMAMDEAFVHRFFEIVLDYQKRVIERYYPPLAPYIDYTSSGDDFATQSSLFISPAMFEEFVAPYFKERIDCTKRVCGAKYLHHSCGNVSRLIPRLMDCGVEILNPIQPTGADMQPEKLKAAFGRDIVFHGGLDTQSVLPGGTEESVRESVFALLDAMQPGGGYIFAAAHNLQGDVPPENIVAMFRAARAWKGR